jgi:hypothetical protein
VPVTSTTTSLVPAVFSVSFNSVTYLVVYVVNSAQSIAGSHKEVSEAASAVLLLAVIVGLCEVSC